MVYYKLYLGIAEELQRVTGVFTVNGSTSGDLRGLNLCMAPGGYTQALLVHNPKMFISGITLSEAQTGHPVVVEVKEHAQVDVQYLDINLLAASMGVAASEIPGGHPDVTKFLHDVPFPEDLEFDVVIADGAVLRTHERGEHRQEKDLEAMRLRLSQLILGFNQIKDGGTFMLLLHRIDSWENFVLLRTIGRFSDVKVHKPTEKHAQSSSFYLVAKNVQRNEAAMDALNKWKADWRQVTFGGEGSKGELPRGPGSIAVETAVQSHGAKFIELGRPIWKTQASVSHD